MFARVARLCIAVAAGGLLVTGCGPKKPPPPPLTRIAFVASPQGFGDGGFNDEARAALVACNRETGIAADTAVPADDADSEAKLVLDATEKFDTIIGTGYALAPALARVARRFEGAHFALIDAVADQPNVESITFDEPQGAFLAGMLAALTSKTRHIAFLGGADVPLLERSEAGFVAGARQADPRVHVTVRYLQSFTAAGPAQTAAAALLAGGNDRLFVIAGAAGRGAFRAVTAQPGALIIGADTDEAALAPGKVLTSVVKRVDTAVLRVCRETVGGKTQSGRIVLGLADGGIGLAPLLAHAVAAPVAARVARARAALIAGRIHAPATRAELARFVPAPGL